MIYSWIEQEKQIFPPDHQTMSQTSAASANLANIYSNFLLKIRETTEAKVANAYPVNNQFYTHTHKNCIFCKKNL